MMKIQEVIGNFKGRRVNDHCPWDIKAVNIQCLHFWEEGKGRSNKLEVCGGEQHCTKCKDSDSKEFICVNALTEKSGYSKSGYRRK